MFFSVFLQVQQNNLVLPLTRDVVKFNLDIMYFKCWLSSFILKDLIFIYLAQTVTCRKMRNRKNKNLTFYIISLPINMLNSPIQLVPFNKTKFLRVTRFESLVLYIIFKKSLSSFIFYNFSTQRVCAKSLQSCPTLCDPMDCSLPGSSVPGILQARTLEWVAMPSSKGSS